MNAEIESYLRTHQSDLESKVEYWMEKYDKDVEAKQHELDVLKASKAKDLERLQELTKLVSNWCFWKFRLSASKSVRSVTICLLTTTGWSDLCMYVTRYVTSCIAQCENTL